MSGQLQILLKNWSIVQDKEEGKKIAGTYVVMCGDTQVAEKEFNEGYNNQKIGFPSELMVEAETLTKKIEAGIKEFFLGKENHG